MSLQIAADYMASKGRGQDSMLVHMTPGEVAGLQALAVRQGGTLTLNPDTGLPEAGILSSILPAIAGFALGPAGFTLMSPELAGLTVGGATALATGSLARGLSAGLGAFGGAGLGEGMFNAGVGLAGAAPAAGAPVGIAEAAAANAGASGLGAEGVAAAAREAALKTPFETAMRGASTYLSTTPGMIKAGMLALPLLAATPETTAAPAAAPYRPLTEEEKAPFYPYDYSFSGTPEPYAGPESGERLYKSGYTRRAGYAEGGEVGPPAGIPGLAQRHALVDSMGAGESRDALSYLMGLGPQVRPAGVGAPGYSAPSGLEKYVPPGAEPAPPELSMQDRLRQLMVPQQPPLPVYMRNTMYGPLGNSGYASGGPIAPAGRFLRGPGDGVSDSIPGVVNGRELAKFADGEFVVPARVVSELGNGSSEAGSRKLHAMIDRVQKRRAKTVGKGQVAVDSRAERGLPA